MSVDCQQEVEKIKNFLNFSKKIVKEISVEKTSHSNILYGLLNSETFSAFLDFSVDYIKFYRFSSHSSTERIEKYLERLKKCFQQTLEFRSGKRQKLQKKKEYEAAIFVRDKVCCEQMKIFQTHHIVVEFPSRCCYVAAADSVRRRRKNVKWKKVKYKTCQHKNIWIRILSILYCIFLFYSSHDARKIFSQLNKQQTKTKHEGHEWRTTA